MNKQNMSQNIIRRRRLELLTGYIFIGPFILGFLLFSLIPMLVSLYLSFTRYDILSAPVFIGLENFKRMFTMDPIFLKSIRVTLYYVIASVPLKLIMALAVAVIFFKNDRFTRFFRSVYYLPSILGSSVAISVVWIRLFAGDGVLNSLLGRIGIHTDIGWLSQPSTAIWALILLSVWQFGSSMLVFLSGLKQIPSTYLEAAKVDGAGRIRTFFKVTLPLLTPMIFFNLIQQMINAFTTFTQGYIITNGRPLNSTLFYAVYMHRRSFTFYEMGYGSAMAWLMLVILSIVTALIFATSKFWVHRESE